LGTLGDAINLFRCCVFTLNALTVVLPAFLIAGAVVVFVPSYSVMKYLGAKANRILSYGVSAVSGNVLTVCSCNVVPIFAGILRRGAGIGPAFCFVFAAPAIHIVNTVMTYRVIGWQLALWRLFTVPIIAILIGASMAFLFRKEQKERNAQAASTGAIALVAADHSQARKAELFLGLLVLILVFGAWLGFDNLPIFPKGLGQYVRVGIVVLALAASAVVARRWFGKEETGEWGRQTYLLLRMILPIFIPAVIVIALIVKHIPLSWTMQTASHQGGLVFGHPEGNRLLPVFVATLFGTLMYFPMLTEVVFVKGLLKESYFAVGPALAILLGGPGLSLPGLLLVSRIAGWKKTIVYWLLTVVFITGVSFWVGSYYGKYKCPCQYAQQAKRPRVPDARLALNSLEPDDQTRDRAGHRALVVGERRDPVGRGLYLGVGVGNRDPAARPLQHGDVVAAVAHRKHQ
jgi:hypothetical protein